MGVDCDIRLPANVRLDTVVRVMGALAGGIKTRESLGWSHSNSFVTHIAGASASGLPELPSLAIIQLDIPCIDGVSVHDCIYHFESYGGHRMLSPKSTAFWVAMGARLIEYFGGSIDYNDCDDVYADESYPAKPDIHNCPDDGVEWQLAEDRIYDIVPITLEELHQYAELIGES